MQQAGGGDGASRRYYARLAEDYRQRRDLLYGAPEEVGLAPMVPDGAYYVFGFPKRRGDLAAGRRAAGQAGS